MKRNFVICSHIVALGLRNVGQYDGLSMWLEWEKQKTHASFWL
jgi:hypothetical protein